MKKDIYRDEFMLSFTCATWNVNSFRVRCQHVIDWLKNTAVDILCLQEIKCEDAVFPREAFEDLGYNIALWGQKTYNGVAIFSRFPFETVTRDFPGNPRPDQARMLQIEISPRKGDLWRIVSVYIPNGGQGEEAYRYKISFLEGLKNHVKSLGEGPVLIGGDMNVALEDKDVDDPLKRQGTPLCTPEERRALRAIFLSSGYQDIWRLKHPTSRDLSWWDYRGQGFLRNEGLRIDSIWGSPEACDRVQNARIDITPRGWEKPSDHAPVITTLGLLP